jgi:hypothetical protein
MSEATRLRAQKAFSTDPDYLERMALAEEARDARVFRSDDCRPPGTAPERRRCDDETQRAIRLGTVPDQMISM